MCMREFVQGWPVITSNRELRERLPEKVSSEQQSRCGDTMWIPAEEEQ